MKGLVGHIGGCWIKQFGVLGGNSANGSEGHIGGCWGKRYGVLGDQIEGTWGRC